MLCGRNTAINKKQYFLKKSLPLPSRCGSGVEYQPKNQGSLVRFPIDGAHARVVGLIPRSGCAWGSPSSPCFPPPPLCSPPSPLLSLPGFPRITRCILQAQGLGPAVPRTWTAPQSPSAWPPLHSGPSDPLILPYFRPQPLPVI